MILNYLKILARNLWKNRFFSLLNLLGLAVGMGAYLLILHYVNFELSYDDYHQNSDRIYRLQRNVYENNTLKKQLAQTSFNVGPALRDEYPGIVDVVRCRTFLDNTVSYGDRKYRDEAVYISEPALFRVFSYRLLRGDEKSALEGPDKVVISERTARKYFGSDNPLGKILKITNLGKEYTCSVSGVMENVPENSHMRFDLVMTLDTFWKTSHSDWIFSFFHTYLLLGPGVSVADLESDFPPFIEKYIVANVPAAARWKFKLQPLRDIYLYSNLTYDTKNGDGEAAYFLLIAAFVILLISWLNYVNLSTAQAMDRAREVGMRKVVGAHRGQLIKQFLGESLLVNILPVILSVLALIYFLPVLREFSGKQIPFYLTRDWTFSLHILLLYLGGSLLSGLYPAFVLSAFKPVTMLKRTKLSQTTGGSRLRRILVSFQFIVSAILIIVGFTVYSQVNYMRTKDLGIKLDNLVGIPMPSTPLNEEYIRSASGLKTELLRYPGIENVAGSSMIPGSEPIFWRLAWQSEKDFKTGKVQSVISVDYEFIPTYGIEMVVGRNFSREYGADKSGAIINETSLKLLGFDSPDAALDQKISLWAMKGTWRIIGVMKDYHHQSLKKSYDPVVFLLDPDYKRYYSLKLKDSADIAGSLGTVKEQWEKVFPGYPFNYFFLDEHFNKQYKIDLQFGKVLGLFVLLALLITCLGLLSLSYFSVLQRKREIGVRKSFGALSGDIMRLLSMDTVRLVIISVLTAWPIAYFVVDGWLQNYAYRIGVPILFFILSGTILVLIGLLTVGYHTLGASRTNPVEALRDE